MRHLKYFSELSNSGVDTITLKWCNNLISESEFIRYLDSDILNEGLFDFVDFKKKILNVFNTFVNKSFELGLSIYDKVSTFIKWLINKIESLREKNPKLFKVILITIIIIVILIVTTSTAKAASTNSPIPVNKINMAIGWLNQLKGEQDPLLLNKAITHLIDLRDGDVDITELGTEAINMSNAALTTVDQIMGETKTSTDPSFYKFCIGLIENGKDYVNAIYTKSDGFENVKIIMK